MVLDPGGFPNPAVPSIARVYDYDYQWNPFTHAFIATLARTVSFAGLPLVFAEDVEVTSSGLYVVAESVIGALWVIQADGSIIPGVFPSGGVPIPALGPCTLQPVTIWRNSVCDRRTLRTWSAFPNIPQWPTIFL